MKKVSIAHPRAVATPDDWVKQKPAVMSEEPMKRLTIDIPVSLHTRIKIGCAASQLKMSDAVRALLEAQWPVTKDGRLEPGQVQQPAGSAFAAVVAGSNNGHTAVVTIGPAADNPSDRVKAVNNTPSPQERTDS